MSTYGFVLGLPYIYSLVALLDSTIKLLYLYLQNHMLLCMLERLVY